MTLQSGVPRARAIASIAAQFSLPMAVSAYALVKMIGIEAGSLAAWSNATLLTARTASKNSALPNSNNPNAML